MVPHSRRRRGSFQKHGVTKGRGGGGATRTLLVATQEILPLHVLTGEPGDRFGGAGIETA